MTRASLFFLLLLCMSACQPGSPGLTLQQAEAENAKLTTSDTDSKAAPLTQTDTPNKPASAQAADVETQDLDSLRAELQALNKDLARIKTDLSVTEPQRNATRDIVPDTQTSTPRALATDGVFKIPDSKEELLAKDIGLVQAVRVGNHDRKQRIVIEITGGAGPKPRATLSGETLMIQLFNVHWPEATQQIASLEDALGVSKVTKQEDDTIVTIALDKAHGGGKEVTLQSQMMLPPATQGGARRFVVDLGLAD